MNFSIALQQMQDGMRFTRGEWSDPNTVVWLDPVARDFKSKAVVGGEVVVETWLPDNEDLLALDWEFVR